MARRRSTTALAKESDAQRFAAGTGQLELPALTTGQVQLVMDQDHQARVVQKGILRASVSLDIATADFKAMIVPSTTGQRRGQSIIIHLARLAQRGVEVRLLHSGVPSSAALSELKRGVPRGLTIRRCPRLHAKIVIIDSSAMYLGSANLTGAGLGAKADHRRNFETGIWTHDEPMIDTLQDYFNAIWEGRHCLTCQRRDICPVPLEEPDVVAVKD
jgi:phosphatidylserine/phosphatidylglycerophosphate/cardiolipin synthase-like enzyme